MQDLRTFLQQTFEKSDGVMSFEAFMAMALYDPEFGYYTTGIEGVGGREGDFATAPTLTLALSGAIAGWLQECLAQVSSKSPVHVIEVGGGNGALAAGALGQLSWWERRRLRFHLVEVSPPLRAQQQLRLKRYRVRWHETILSALAASGGEALIYSNELVDAFPAKWLRWSAELKAWQEIMVVYDSVTGLKEVFRDLPKDLDQSMFSAMALADLSEGQRIETQPSYQQWLTEMAEEWKSGAMLTIDYGGSAEEIYHRRRGGTLRGYYRQERVEGGAIYQRVGKQDLTVDVNFTDLIQWGEALGWNTVRDETQREFLSKFGFAADTMAESAAGSAFRVLEHRRD